MKESKKVIRSSLKPTRKSSTAAAAAATTATAAVADDCHGQADHVKK
jgi:hypothetical protein